jgi:hypothetical protein
MKKRTSSDELRLAARRALAFGYAAIDSPSRNQVGKALELVRRVLAVLDDQLCGGEIRELAVALRTMATELSGLAERTA